MAETRYKYIQQCARLLLKRHNLTTAPVDLVSIVTKEGLEYEEVEYFDDEVDALIVQYGSRTIALVNKKHIPARRRFSLAHELCHHLYHGDRTILNETTTIDSVADDATFCGSRKDVYEQEADLFASELLIPLELLKKHANKPIEEISSIFQVSQQAASIAISRHFNSLYK